MAALFLLFLAMSGSSALGQDNSFQFVVVTKTKDHPFFGLGSPYGYAVKSALGVAKADYGEIDNVNFVEGGELLLQRNMTYFFNLSGLSQVSFLYLSTGPEGGGIERFTPSSGVSYVDSPNINSADSFYFTAGPSTPSVLYYVGESGEYMGGLIRVLDEVEAYDIGSGGSAAPGIVTSPFLPPPQQISVSMADPNLLIRSSYQNMACVQGSC